MHGVQAKEICDMGIELGFVEDERHLCVNKGYGEVKDA